MMKTDLILLHAPSVYDFRKEAILYGPVSDMVPSTPVFEMYPIGFTTMAEYLQRHGLQTRIINLAVLMLQDAGFDVEHYLKRLDAAAFGIDLHWMPHAHGSVEIARLLKRIHPFRPVIFGGFSATYYHCQLILYPEVDFILRGDSTEPPLLQLMHYIRSGGKTRPSPATADYACLEKIPNLVWKDSETNIHINPISHVPDDLDDFWVDYVGVMRSVLRYRDLMGAIPFANWLRYPATAAISVHGCRYNCVTCGGSASSFRSYFNRQSPAYPSPQKLADGIRRIGQFNNAPVMVLGDIRMAGDEYADIFLDALSGYKKPVMFEFFVPPPPSFYKRMAAALSHFTIEISMESHNEQVRRAFGRVYSNQEMERSINAALDAGCSRFDLFFMIGLKGQTCQSVMETVDYTRLLLAKKVGNGEHRINPFISPMAPFLDPGSQAFEEPEKHGFRLFYRTLEEHRQALLSPSWKYVLNYETKWMNRDQIVAATYEAARRMNRVKEEFGVISSTCANTTEKRITTAAGLIDQIDHIMTSVTNPAERQHCFIELKAQVDTANLGTVCDKGELEVELPGGSIRWIQAAGLVLKDWVQDLRKGSKRTQK
jgi:B12-binding domain/radical SAM domain protein